MKKLFLLGLAIVLFTACQEKQEQRYFAESPEIDVLKAGIEAYEKADWDTWRGHFADTAKIYVNSKEPISLDARVTNLKEMSGAFSSYGFDKKDAYIEMVLDKEKETWVYYWAQHNATVAANKKELSIPVHLAVQFADGKIVAEHVYFDGTAMNKAFEELAAAKEPETE
jgi:ketosteroid isomerase-like protein